MGHHARALRFGIFHGWSAASCCITQIGRLYRVIRCGPSMDVKAEPSGKEDTSNCRSCSFDSQPLSAMHRTQTQGSRSGTDPSDLMTGLDLRPNRIGVVSCTYFGRRGRYCTYYGKSNFYREIHAKVATPTRERRLRRISRIPGRWEVPLRKVHAGAEMVVGRASRRTDCLHGSSHFFYLFQSLVRARIVADNRLGWS